MKSYMESTYNVTPIADNHGVRIQNGTYATLKDNNISFNNNRVKHNREPMKLTTYLNFLENSPYYTESVVVHYGFSSDVYDQNRDAAETGFRSRGTLFSDTNADDRFPFKLTVALKHVSEFIRKLNLVVCYRISYQSHKIYS